MKIFTSTIILFILSMPAQAGNVNQGNMHTFTSGTPAVAAEVNDNFTEHTAQINDNNALIAQMQQTIDEIQALVESLQSQLTDVTNQVTAINDSAAMALNTYLSIDTQSNPNGPTLVFEGVDLQLSNGAGQTDSTNGLGNLIIGYNESDAVSGGREGSHNLIVGPNNSYSAFSGLLVGAGHSLGANANYASILAGQSINSLFPESIAAPDFSVNDAGVNISSSLGVNINSGSALSLQGSVVQINAPGGAGSPAARVGDFVVDAGAPSGSIVTGSPTVLIGP